MSLSSARALLSPELSIIIPVLDEIDELPKFLSAMLLQQEVQFEIIFVDGGSSDGTLEWLYKQHGEHTDITILSSGRGRGCQLNTGVTAARGEWLLFLHVDSRFDNVMALRKAVDVMAGTPRLFAGHFPLQFRRTGSARSAAYFFYEAKAASNRAETVHGDQGFLMHRDLYARVGAFDSTLPVMEDTDYAERIRRIGQWVLLPDVVTTSARRFEVEGLWQRQLLGALIMCFRSIGWVDFFLQAPHVYRLQKSTRRLEVLPFFVLVRTMLDQLPRAKRNQIWSRSGAYVRGHAWQLFFCVDTLIAYHQHQAPHQVRALVTSYCQPVFEFLTDNKGGHLFATFALRVWFSLTGFILSRLEKRQ